MARQWTAAQQAAISARGADILVAAAAGSGKTAVLVERIIQRITDVNQPVDLDRLLVVTFTNAAAAEMRERIGLALEKSLEKDPENELLLNQMALLPRASITTIHAFCHKILRSNFNLLGLDPTFSLADPTENDLIRLSALEEVIEEMYEDPVYAEDFLMLTESYLTIKQPDEFYQLLNHIYDFSMSLPEPEVWLKQSAESFRQAAAMPFDNTQMASLIVEAGKDKVEGILKKYDKMLHMADSDDGGEVLVPFLKEEKKQFEALMTVSGYSKFYEDLSALSFKTMPKAPKESEPRFREEIRKMFEGAK